MMPEKDTQVSDAIPLAVRLRDEMGPPLPQMVAQQYARYLNAADKDCEVCGGDCAAANPPVMNCPRDECARRGIDPDEICADGGVTAEMVVAKEIDAGCGQAVITPWQTPSPCAGQIGLEWLTLRREIMRLIRDEFDPTPANWEGRDWNDNAEDTADKILAAVKIAMRSEVVRKDFV